MPYGHTPFTDYRVVPASRYMERLSASSPVTWYFRKRVKIAEPERIQALKLRLTRWAGAAVYLNGQEVVRHNLAPEAGHNSLASKPERGGPFRAHVFELDTAPLQAGDNLLAVEVHRYARNAYLYFDLKLEALLKGEG